MFDIFSCLLIICFQTTNSLPYLYHVHMSEQSHCSKFSKNLRGGGVWCYSCATYQHVKCSGPRARQEHHENFRCVSCKRKATLIFLETTTLSHAAADSQTSEASREACPEPFGYWLNLQESPKNAFEEHLQTSYSWESNLFYAAKKQDRH